jgi:hypothetical protein
MTGKYLLNGECLGSIGRAGPLGNASRLVALPGGPPMPGPARLVAPLLLALQQRLEGAAACGRVRAPRPLLLFGPGRERAAPLLIAFLAQEQMAADGPDMSCGGAAAEADRVILDRDRVTFMAAAASDSRAQARVVAGSIP